MRTDSVRSGKILWFFLLFPWHVYSQVKTPEVTSDYAHLRSLWNTPSSSLKAECTSEELELMILTHHGPNAKIVKLILGTCQTPEWIVEKNDLDIPKSQFLNQKISAFINTTVGDCLFISGFIKKNYQGNGRYGRLIFSASENLKYPCQLYRNF
jgi:hypothetical protein